MRRINVLPPEDRRRVAGGPILQNPVELLVVVGVVLLIIMVSVYLFYLLRLGNEREAVMQLDQDIARQEQRLAELEPYRDLQDRLAAKERIADGVWRARFPWDEFLQALAFVIPESTALNGLAGQASFADLQAPVGQPIEPQGSVTFTGIALPNYQNVADFIVRMNSIPFLANSRLISAELDRESYEEPAIGYEVASEMVTVAGQDGTQVPLRVEQESP
jgi:type IV pilus assembly protein PilN